MTQRAFSNRDGAMDFEQLRNLAEHVIPFNQFLGMRLVEVREGFARMELPFRVEFIGDPSRPALHGGVISALADTTGGFAVWSQVIDPRGRVSTIDLRVDYLRPGRSETLVAEAKVVRQGNRVGVVDIALFHPENEGQFVATGKGVYNITLAKSA